MGYQRRPSGPVGWIISGVVFLAAIIGYFVLSNYEEELVEEQLRLDAETRGPVWVDETTAEVPADNVKGGDAIGEAPPLNGRNVALAKNSFAPGERIEVSYKAEEWFDSTAWLGIVPADIPHGSEAENDLHDIEYRYLDGASGVLSFTAPDKPGEYDMRLHSSDDNGKEVASVNFTVR